MTKFIALAAPLALLAACSSGGDADADGDGEITGEEMAAEASNVNIQPGEWEATVQFTEFDMPDMPDEMREMMRQQIGQPQTSTSCITPEQAANPEAEMFNSDDNDSCEYSEFRMSGGQILIEATCSGGDMPGTATMRMEGSYTPTSYAMQMQMDMEGAPSGPMHMAGEVNARRTGECTEGEG